MIKVTRCLETTWRCREPRSVKKHVLASGEGAKSTLAFSDTRDTPFVALICLHAPSLRFALILVRVLSFHVFQPLLLQRPLSASLGRNRTVRYFSKFILDKG